MASGLGPVAAIDHAAPAPPAGPGAVQKDPAASRVGTLTQSVRWYRNEQLSRRAAPRLVDAAHYAARLVGSPPGGIPQLRPPDPPVVRTLVVASGLGPVAAIDHAAPAPPAGPGAVQKDPPASRVGTLTQSVRWYRNEQLSRRFDNG